jgi:hypothetical protein
MKYKGGIVKSIFNKKEYEKSARTYKSKAK